MFFKPSVSRVVQITQRHVPDKSTSESDISRIEKRGQITYVFEDEYWTLNHKMFMYQKYLNYMTSSLQIHYQVMTQPENMISKRVKNHLPLLEFMRKCDSKTMKHMIRHCDSDMLKSLCEICQNTIRGNVRLTPTHFKRLKRYKKQLSTVTNSKSSDKQKRQSLQKGGFLPALLGAVIPAIIGAIGGSIATR